MRAITLIPKCPHSLSFRPMVLPENVEVKLKIGKNSRTSVEVYSDGRCKGNIEQDD